MRAPVVRSSIALSSSRTDRYRCPRQRYNSALFGAMARPRVKVWIASRNCRAPDCATPRAMILSTLRGSAASADVAAFFLQMTQPALADWLVFVPRYVLLQPWTIVTYMFLHGNYMHILFNMLALYFFGPRVEDRIGSRRFTILYFLSGISGAL